MKKIIYFLLIILLVAGIAGGAYAGYKYLKKDKDVPATKTNILTESKDLLNNHASITFGEGDSAWTISTADKLEPIYIDDLRVKGKGIELEEHRSSNGEGVDLPLNNVKIEQTNLVNILITGSVLGSTGESFVSSFSSEIVRKNNSFVWFDCSGSIYENLFHCLWSESNYEANIADIEKRIAETTTSGDNYYIGSFQFMFEFKNVEKYGDNSLLLEPERKVSNSVLIIVEIPVYYRVK